MLSIGSYLKAGGVEWTMKASQAELKLKVVLQPGVKLSLLDP
jgi:hypothetical protein